MLCDQVRDSCVLWAQVLVIFQALQQDLRSSISSVQQLDQELQRCMEQVRELAVLGKRI